MEQLKQAARARNLSAIRKRKNGPILLMESRTGKTVGIYTDADLAMEEVLKYDIVEAVEAIPVIWNTEADRKVEPVYYGCANGFGPYCLCQDQTAVYLCVAPRCVSKADCHGICRDHFSQLKVFGDLTALAIQKTQTMANGGEFDLVNLPSKKYLSLKTVRPTDRSPSSLTSKEILQATDGVIGMSVRWTGSEFLLCDKDGFVLDRTSTKKELLEPYTDEEETALEETALEETALEETALEETTLEETALEEPVLEELVLEELVLETEVSGAEPPVVLEGEDDN